jgi:hypothetical protein
MADIRDAMKERAAAMRAKTDESDRQRIAAYVEMVRRGEQLPAMTIEDTIRLTEELSKTE